jgi:tetratricopeptide (TPR) repeat protein
LAGNTSNGICGREIFYEHVHFNFDGNFRLGHAWAEQIEKMLPASISHTGRTNVWATQETCDQILALTDWNRCAVVETMLDRLKRPPLNGQANNAERMRLLRDQAGELRHRMNLAASQKAVEIYQAAINRAPRDHLLYENFAEFLEFTGELKQAVAQWQRMQELLPHSCEPFYQAGRLLSELGQWTEAETALTRAVALRPRLAEGWFELGDVHLSTKEFESALQNYNHARQLDPENATYCAFAGKALSKLNHHAEAVQLYLEAIQLQPDLWEAHFALGDEWGGAGRFSEAEDQYRQVIRLRPSLALAHLDHGAMLTRLGQFDKAQEEFEETLRLEPGNRSAQEYFNQLKDRKNAGTTK